MSEEEHGSEETHLDLALHAVKLVKRLKHAVEEDARDYALHDLLGEIHAFDKKYKMNGNIAKALGEKFNVLTEHRTYSAVEFEVFRKLLMEYVTVLQQSYLICKLYHLQEVHGLTVYRYF